MSEHETSDQLRLMKRDLQRIRLAIIVIAAFFIYQTIGPLFSVEGRVEVQKTVKVQELLVVNDFGETIVYLGSDGSSAGMTFDDEVGNRLDLRATSIRLMVPGNGGLAEQLRVQPDGIRVYDQAGQLAGTFPRH